MADRVDILFAARSTVAPVAKATAQDVLGVGAAADKASSGLVGAGTASKGAASGLETFRQRAAAAKGSALDFNKGLDAIKSGLLGLTAIDLATRAIESFGEALKFKSELDATTQSIAIQLRGVRDSATVFSEAQAFAERYKLTQADLSQTLASSIGIFRQTSASTEDLLSTLLRLQATAPEKPVSEAARAVRELASGDVTSIKELFNVSAKDANRMKTEIAGGADAIKVVSEYLDRAGAAWSCWSSARAGRPGPSRIWRRPRRT